MRSYGCYKPLPAVLLQPNTSVHTLSSNKYSSHAHLYRRCSYIGSFGAYYCIRNRYSKKIPCCGNRSQCRQLGSNRKPSDHVETRLQLTSPKAISSIVSLALIAFKPLRDRAYELIILSHKVASLLLVAAIVLHRITLGTERVTNISAFINTSSGPYIFSNVITASVSLLFAFLCFLYQNLGYKSNKVVKIEEHSDAIELAIRVSAHRWTVGPGQCIGVTIPRAGLGSVFQNHPFNVMWWAKGPNDTLDLTVLIKRRQGFTNKLIRLVGAPNITRAYLHSSINYRLDFGRYGTVLFFATGIGISAVLPHIRKLFEDMEEHQSKARRITLIWLVEKECKFTHLCHSLLTENHYFNCDLLYRPQGLGTRESEPVACERQRLCIVPLTLGER